MSKYHLFDKECWDGGEEEGRRNANTALLAAQQWTGPLGLRIWIIHGQETLC